MGNTHFRKFDNHTDYVDELESIALIDHNLSYCKDNDDVHYDDYIYRYFTTVALTDGEIWLILSEFATAELITSISYSTDNGKTWTTHQNANHSGNVFVKVPVNAGDKVIWKGQATAYSDGDQRAFFGSTCSYNVEGNIMSLLYGDNFYNKVSLETNENAFGYLFSCNNQNSEYPMASLLVSAKKLQLPATTLSEQCYMGMFINCNLLIDTPKLPATELEGSCYQAMFSGCSSIVNPPKLPATTLANSCYSSMFSGCTSLTKAPELPATELYHSCYSYMFSVCTSLTKAPVLPATTLVTECYAYMFMETKISYIKALFIDASFQNHCLQWLSTTQTISNGVFIKNPHSVFNDPRIIPAGWKVYSEYEEPDPDDPDEP